MDRKGDDFRKKLLATFTVEAREHIRALSSGLLELEKASAPEKQMSELETIFREAHSLKGAARAVNVAEIEGVCQSLESVFSVWRRQEIAPSPALFDLLHLAADTLEKILQSIERGQHVAEPSGTAALIQSLENAQKGALTGTRPEEPKRKQEETAPGDVSRVSAEARPPSLETVRLAAEKLDALLLEAEELLATKLAASQRAAEVREINAAVALWSKARSQINPYLRALQSSLAGDAQSGPGNGSGRKQAQTGKLLELLDQDHGFFISLEARLAALEKSAERDHRSLGTMVDQLLADMKSVVMLPVSSLLESCPRLVRDLARDRGKAVELVVQGAEIEMDRRILEGIKDPLVHLVRNCVDHGIEDPQERERRKKPRQGTIRIGVSRKDSDKVELVITDDGAGLQAVKVRAAALKLGMISPEEARTMEDGQMLPLVFQSGLSTSPMITDISGRGLGLAIVREKVEKLGGTVSLETHAGLGTEFRILLPLTRATFRGVLIRVEERIFVLPTAQVERVLRVRQEEIKTVENRETIQLDGQAVSLVRLRDVLNLPAQGPSHEAAETKHVVVLGSPEKRIAFAVGEVLNEQEVLAKPLSRQLSRVRNVAGATVLATGSVAPILDVADLMKSAVRVSTTRAAPAVPAAEAEAKKKSILVAEDSITARTLLKNILESAGYQVQTAVDGAEAWATLKTLAFDVVVSDVDMPRMNGFDLTAKIRADKGLAELPVVLVTALESREDRERGIDVGANAYIVKSSFDQSNLLEVLRRLS